MVKGLPFVAVQIGIIHAKFKRKSIAVQCLAITFLRITRMSFGSQDLYKSAKRNWFEFQRLVIRFERLVIASKPAESISSILNIERIIGVQFDSLFIATQCLLIQAQL